MKIAAQEKEAFMDAMQVAVYTRAEELASEVGKDGLRDYLMQVDVDGETYDFIVDVVVTNYEFEEETNSQSFNVEIFVCKTPDSEVEELEEWMEHMFYHETIYRD